MRRNSNLSPVEYIEETIVEFYKRRRLLADSIELLLSAALHSDASPTLEQLRAYVHSELLPSKPAAGGESTFGHRLFKAIQQHDAVIAKVDVALKNATSNTVSPSQQSECFLVFQTG
jgi:nuclear pore complex protein Nup205